jgi:hypothetical protein
MMCLGSPAEASQLDRPLLFCREIQATLPTFSGTAIM